MSQLILVMFLLFVFFSDRDRIWQDCSSRIEWRCCIFDLTSQW